MAGSRAARRHRVVSVVVDEMSAFEPVVAAEFFGIGESWRGIPWYRFTVCSPDPSPVRLGLFKVEVEHGVEALRGADTVIIPAWCDTRRRPSPALVDALRAAHRRGARMVSFCTGAFALAEAGILDGRPATTHWAAVEEFEQRFPSVRLDPAVLYVDDGDVLTSAGAAASIDLSIHIIRRDLGAEIANAIARSMVIPPHRAGGQAQYVDAPVPARSLAEEDPVAAVLDWARRHLAEPLSIERLAAQAMVGPRHFTRRFRAITGTTPHQWVLAQRLALAQRLLETTDDPIERVADAAGFGTAAAFRLHFQRSLGTSPLAYRKTFRHSVA
jgi:AraC family transcriptional regulator, transcriptional activator FtrA